MMRRSLAARGFGFALLAASASLSAACIAVDANGPYTQDFDALSNTAGSTTNTLSIPGWSMTEAGGGARDNEQYAVDNGGSLTGDTYSYGASAATERALGSLRAGLLIPVFGACFVNNMSFPITALVIGYTGEEWRLGTADRADALDFQYSTDATDLASGTWTDVPALDFVTPDTTTTGAKNGNSAADSKSIAAAIAPLHVAAGATLWIRWVDADASGGDDGLAVDDFALDVDTIFSSGFD